MLKPVLSLAYFSLKQVSLGYRDREVVHEVNFSMRQGEIACLLGPSGSGKSTLLRAIAGLEPISSGEIRLQDQIFSKRGFTLAPEKRGVGMVFQDMALFPHFTVAENIGFGLRGWNDIDKKQRVADLLDLVGLAGIQNRYPHELSGGQQQRVALVRAIGPRPKLILLDEPFSGLDAGLRESLVLEVRELLLKEKMSALLVTHDQREAFTIADKVAIMESGRLVQSGTPQTIYHEPSSHFVADFIGVGEFIPGMILDERRVETPLGILESNHGGYFSAGEAVKVLIRPGDVLQDDDSDIRAQIIRKQFRGSHFLCRIRLLSGEEVYYLDATHDEHAIGSEVTVSLDVTDVIMFSEER